MTKHPKKAFTLVELLIVVAIIGILAVIAVPNFLNARMKAMVTRVHADMDAVAKALESYNVDEGSYPYYKNPQDYVTALSGGALIYLPVRLTTPTSYLSSLPIDPFPPKYLPASETDFSNKPYQYLTGYDQVYKNQVFIGSHIDIHFQNATGGKNNIKWEVWSFGPDGVVAHDGTQFDISNGLNSTGDISRFGP